MKMIMEIKIYINSIEGEIEKIYLRPGKDGIFHILGCITKNKRTGEEEIEKEMKQIEKKDVIKWLKKND